MSTRRKITFIGAGSTVFAKNLIGDILSFPELADSAICLFDIDKERLKTSAVVAGRIAQMDADRENSRVGYPGKRALIQWDPQQNGARERL